MSQSLAAVKRHGKHYTPMALADFLAARVLDHMGVSTGTTVRLLDPACGDGELLFAAHRVAARKYPGMTISLAGYDLDTEAVQCAHERSAALGITADLHSGDFLDVGRKLTSGAFDAVITNPPYVRTQQLGHETAQLLATEFGLTGRIDLTHPFVTMMSDLLRPGGVLGLLCSNRFLTTKAGANMRRVFQSALEPVEIYDLGDTKLFNAAVLPAIVIALNQRHKSTKSCTYISAYESELPPATDASLYDALLGGVDSVVSHEGRSIAIRAGRLVQPMSISEPWRLASISGDEWLRKVGAATWRTFGDVAKIRVGIKTTADRVFISDDWEAAEPNPEAELLLPLITHDNLTPWCVSADLRTRVLYPYDRSHEKRTLVDMSKYPAAMAYLNSHAEQLKARRYVVEGGREWFEIWVPQKPALWAIPKIVFPDISVNGRFALDRSGAVVNGDCYWISLADIRNDDLAYLMLAVGNSRLGLRFYDEVCGNKLYSGRRRWMTQYVARLPVPDPGTEVAAELVDSVRKLLDAGRPPTEEQTDAIDNLVEQCFERPIADRTGQPETLF